MIHQRTAAQYINQRNFILAVALLVLAAVVGFFGYEFKFLRAPKLQILAPEKDLITTQDFFDLRGRTDPEADLTVNGRPLYSGATGEFSERVYLVKTLNTFTFEAKNRYGKTTVVTRHIVVP